MHIRQIMLVSLLVLSAIVTNPGLAQESEVDFIVYTVKANDNLFRIALNNNTTAEILAELNGIENTRRIYVGQQIKIPVSGAPPSPQLPTTTSPSELQPSIPISAPGTYIVKRGDTLYKISRATGASVDDLIRLNTLSNPDLLFAGNILTLPAYATTVQSEDPLPIFEDAFDRGIEIFPTADNIELLISQIIALDFTWVKITVNWAEIEPQMGEQMFEELDTIMDALTHNNIQILLTISSAPDWSRESASDAELTESAPPDDFRLFADFAADLAQRYTGVITAYQIWNEPNLRREWRSSQHPIGAESYVELLTLVAGAIRSEDSDAIILSGGLAPTGFNDGFNAIDDRVYLQQMLSLGITDIVDGIGVHPSGFANPPQLICCEQFPDVETHYESTHFYFLDTLREYRDILRDNGAADTFLWVTKFGWGSAEGEVIVAPGADEPYINYVNLEEQALYISDAYGIGEQLGFIRAMFLYNLNGCEMNQAEACFYSLVDASGANRPAIVVMKAIQSSTGG